MEEPTLEERVAELECALSLALDALEHHGKAIRNVIEAGKIMNSELKETSRKADRAYSMTQVIG